MYCYTVTLIPAERAELDAIACAKPTDSLRFRNARMLLDQGDTAGPTGRRPRPWASRCGRWSG